MIVLPWPVATRAPDHLRVMAPNGGFQAAGPCDPPMKENEDD